MSNFKTTKARITHRLLEIEDEAVNNLHEQDLSHTLIINVTTSANENGTKKFTDDYIEFEATLKDTQENEIGVLSFIYEYENGYKPLEKELSQNRKLTLITPNKVRKEYTDLFHDDKKFENALIYCYVEIRSILTDHYINIINEPGVIDDEEGQLIDHYHEREMDKELSGDC